MSRYRAAPALALAAALLVLFAPLLAGRVIFWGIPLLQFYPWRSLAVELIRGGQLPLWNALAGCGSPLLGNYQAALLYPPNWLYLIVPAPHAAGLVSVLHLAWAGLGMMALLRRLGASRQGQGIGALAYALNGFLVARLGVLTMVSAAAWLPWLFWAVEGLALAEGKRETARRIGLTGLATGLLLLAGHAQTAFYSLIFTGFFALWRMRARPGSRRRLLWSLAGAALGAGLAAVQLAPTFELMQQSQRAGGVDYATALSYSFWPWHLLTLALPNLFGSPGTGDYVGFGAYWEDAIFGGVLALGLAGRAVRCWWQARRSGAVVEPLPAVPFFAVSAPPVLVLALGRNTPVFPWLFRHIPTFDMFNGPARWMLLVVFSLAVLAGFGAEGWAWTREGERRALRWLVVGVGFILAAAAVRVALAGSLPASFGRATARLGVTLLLCAAYSLALKWVEASPPRRRVWEAAGLLLLAADLIAAHRGLNPTLPAQVITRASPLAGLAPAGTRTAILPADDYAAKFEYYLDFKDFNQDAEHWAAMRASLLPNLGIPDGLPSASAFDPLQVESVAALLADIESLPREEQAAALARMNVGVLLSPHQRDDLALLGSVPGMYAYAVPDPWPRAVPATCQPADQGLGCERAADGQAAITLDQANRVEVEVEAASAGWLLLLDTDYPGWMALVDNHPVGISRANGAYRAVPIPAGEHKVVFFYRPMSVWIGAAVSAAAALVCAALAVLGWDQRPRLSAADDHDQRSQPYDAVQEHPQAPGVRTVKQDRNHETGHKPLHGE
jgi:hypothetical protein